MHTDGSPARQTIKRQSSPLEKHESVTIAHNPPPPEKYKLEAPAIEHSAPNAPINTPMLIQSTVQSGDSLFKIFARLGLSHATLNKIIATYDDPASPLKYIYPGQTIDFTVEPDSNALVSFAFDKDRLTKVIISRNEDGDFSIREQSRTVSIETAFAEGHIEGAFYLAAKKAGLSDKTILQFADIFAWDLDFTQDIRENDSFQVVYERNHLDDGTIEPGRILTARFVNRSKPITAIAFTDPSGKTSYYTPEGNNVRKAFLRSPVDFARISSHFNLQRKHPVLHTIRAHKGVDYAAKRGTPVKATGDGKVIFKGRKGGYGRVVILQHGQKYSTLYAHLQGFAKQISVGDRVRQSQVIGFIGSSGLATGPHLHYEFRVNNVHKNPLTVKFPNAAPVSKAYRASFEKTARTRLAQIDKLLQTTVARSADATSLPDG
ncbi:MAG: peptidoglycan DD-metalloendopeptidase family protein [Gammaproteobacteria bacterium]